jgi:hypothetical protein
VAQWLRCYVTSGTVPGSIPGGITVFFSDIPSDRTMVLGSTQTLVKISTRNIPGDNGGRCVRLTSPPSRAQCHEIWEPKTPETLWATPGLLWDSFTLQRPRCNVDQSPSSSTEVKKGGGTRLLVLALCPFVGWTGMPLHLRFCRADAFC